MTCAGPQQTMKAAIKHMTIIDKFRISAACLTLKIDIRFSNFCFILTTVIIILLDLQYHKNIPHITWAICEFLKIFDLIYYYFEYRAMRPENAPSRLSCLNKRLRLKFRKKF